MAFLLQRVIAQYKIGCDWIFKCTDISIIKEFRDMKCWSKIVLMMLLAFPSIGTIHANEQNELGLRYYLPWQYNTWEKVTQGNNGGVSHTGTMKYAYDFGMNYEFIYATASGTVSHVEESFTECGNSTLSKKGNRIVIDVDYDGSSAALYLHLAENGAYVKEGDRVEFGQLIGKTGKTGWTGCGAHLHFQRQGQGSWWEQSKKIDFLESSHDDLPDNIETGEVYDLNVGSHYKSANQRAPHTPTQRRSSNYKEQISSESSNEEDTVNSSPLTYSTFTDDSYDFKIDYPSNFGVEDWDISDQLLSKSFIPDEYLETGGYHLPEMYIAVYPKDDNTALSHWLDSHSTSSFERRKSESGITAKYVNVVEEKEMVVAGLDAVTFAVADFMPQQITLVDHGSHVVEIGYIPINDELLKDAYFQTIDSYSVVSEQTPTTVSVTQMSSITKPWMIVTLTVMIAVLVLSLCTFTQQKS